MSAIDGCLIIYTIMHLVADYGFYVHPPQNVTPYLYFSYSAILSIQPAILMPALLFVSTRVRGLDTHFEIIMPSE